MIQLGCFKKKHMKEHDTIGKAYDWYKEKISQHAWTVLGGTLQGSWPSHLHHWKSISSSLKVWFFVIESLLLHHWKFTSSSLKVYFSIIESLLLRHWKCTSSSLKVYNIIMIFHWIFSWFQLLKVSCFFTFPTLSISHGSY